MKQHPTISAEIIESLLDEEYVAGVRHHHERYDGTGYPDGLAGEEIPFIARLLCLVDSYDAMSSRRVYRPALTYDECVVELRSCSGTQFDPELVDAFVRVLGRWPRSASSCRSPRRRPPRASTPTTTPSCAAPRTSRAPSTRASCAACGRSGSRTPRSRRCSPPRPRTSCAACIVVDSDVDDATAVPRARSCSPTTSRSRRSPVAGTTRTSSSWTAGARGSPRRRRSAPRTAPSSARSPPAGSPGTACRRGVLKSAVSDTFAEIMRTAAARQTRAEIESMTDALTGLYNHRRFHELCTETLSASAPTSRGRAALLRHRPLQAAERPPRPSRRRRRAAPRQSHPVLVDPSRRRGGPVRRRRVRRPAARRRHRRGAGGRGAGSPARRRSRRHVRRRGVTISIGVATLSEDRDGEELLASADAAMYAAKEGGRDRVVRADTLKDAPPHLVSEREVLRALPAGA